MPGQTLLDALFHPRPKATAESERADTVSSTVPAAGPGLDVPVVSIDLESTGANVGSDKIVQISLVRFEPGGTVEVFTTDVNPGRPIKPEATAIHHITDERVASAPRFEEIAQRVAAFIGDAALAGYGIAQFDIPLLEREFEEAGIELDLSGRPVVDVKTLYHRLRPRRLEDAYRDYVGRDLDGAHDAGADAQAAFEVLTAMLRQHPNLPQGVVGLAESLRDPTRVDPSGRFVWANGRAVFAFGKHHGQTLEWAAKNAADYLRWIANGDFAPAVRRIVRRALEGRFPVPPGSASVASDAGSGK